MRKHKAKLLPPAIEMNAPPSELLITSQTIPHDIGKSRLAYPTGSRSKHAGKCNQSKGNQSWRLWMMGKARLSPTGRRLTGVELRLARLDEFEKWKTPTQVDFAAIVGPEAYEQYWRELDRIIGELEQSQFMADRLRATIAAASQPPNP